MVGVLGATTAPNAGPDPHVHRDRDEPLSILEDRFRFVVEARTVAAPAGTFLFVPRGTVHAARNIDTTPGRLRAAYVPAGARWDIAAFAQPSAAVRDPLAHILGSEFLASARVLARRCRQPGGIEAPGNKVASLVHLPRVSRRGSVARQA